MSDLGALKQQVEDLRGEITRKRDEKEYSIEDLAASSSAASGSIAVAPKPRRGLRGHFGKIYAMHWGGVQNWQQMVSASQDGKLIIWNAFTTNKRGLRFAAPQVLAVVEIPGLGLVMGPIEGAMDELEIGQAVRLERVEVGADLCFHRFVPAEGG